ELAFEVTAEVREGGMLELERLEDDRGALLELCRDPLDVGASRERRRRPRDVLRVVAEDDLRVLPDDPERGGPQTTRRGTGTRGAASPPAATRRSTSPIDSRSRKRPSSSRGTRRGFRSQFSPKKRSASSGETQRWNALLRVAAVGIAVRTVRVGAA